MTNTSLKDLATTLAGSYADAARATDELRQTVGIPQAKARQFKTEAGLLYYSDDGITYRRVYDMA